MPIRVWRWWTLGAAPRLVRSCQISAWVRHPRAARLILGSTLLLWCTALSAHAQTPPLCTLAWEASTDSTVAGYKLYHSRTSGAYSGPIHVTGLQTQVTCEEMGLTAGDGANHYFVVTAYNTSGGESGFSNEAAKHLPIPLPPPSCVRIGPLSFCKR
jgi:hypothetical protein